MLGAGSLFAQQIKGVSVVGPFIDTASTAIGQIDELHANWISLNPEAIIDRKTLDIIADDDNPFWTYDQEGYRRIIKEAKAKSLKVLLKPHVVVGKNYHPKDQLKSEVTWRGDIVPKFYWQWKDIQENYRAYILSMARYAEAEEVDMFCVGTELKSFIDKRSNFWSALIVEIKEVYTGQLIYSANWDNYMNIPFWDQLDFIGVNGYFPISDQALPEVEQTINNWKPVIAQLNDYSNRYQKKIIITEFGYRNVAYAGLEPWTHNGHSKHESVNQVQYNLLQAFFESVWSEEWLMGGFLWNWNYNELPEGNTDFSVQGKAGMGLVRGVFGK